MREEVREALDRAHELFGIEVTGPESELDKITLNDDGTLSFTTEGRPRVTITEGYEPGKPTKRKSKRELWWHVYVGECDHAGGTVTFIAGESTMHPEQLAAERRTAVPLNWGKDGCDCIARYLRSYDHEPTKAERDWIDGELERLFGGDDGGAD